MTTAVLCSAAFPIIGISIIPTKNSLHPKADVISSMPSTKNSLSMEISIVAITKTKIDFFKVHFGEELPSSC